MNKKPTQRINGSQWESVYKDEKIEEMPWYFPELDHDMVSALKNRGVHNGRFLDIGTGPGTQAIALAKMGFTVSATDISPTAVKLATEKVKQLGLKIAFKRDNILNTKIDEEFDYIFDRGCFHIFEEIKRKEYVRSILRILKPGGYLFLKCFSTKEPGGEGPMRLTPEQIKDIFEVRFDIISIIDSVFEGNRTPPPKALFSIIKRKML